MNIFFSTYNPTHFLQISTTNHGKKYKNPYVNKPKQKYSWTLLFKMSFACFAEMVNHDITAKQSKASKGVQARNAANDDKLEDI
jgi:hypothetical protein